MKIPQEKSLCDYLYLKKAKMLFFFLFFSLSSIKSENRSAGPVLLRWEGWHQWKGEDDGERR
jgi:hypothetical protein